MLILPFKFKCESDGGTLVYLYKVFRDALHRMCNTEGIPLGQTMMTNNSSRLE